MKKEEGEEEKESARDLKISIRNQTLHVNPLAQGICDMLYMIASQQNQLQFLTGLHRRRIAVVYYYHHHYKENREPWLSLYLFPLFV